MQHPINLDPLGHCVINRMVLLDRHRHRPQKELAILVLGHEHHDMVHLAGGPFLGHFHHARRDQVLLLVFGIYGQPYLSA
jgi:hypothetical protein